MKTASPNVRESIYSSAGYAVMAWLVYAVIECWFTIILPWIIKPSYDYIPLHWGFTVLLFVLYPAIGFILGGVTGFGFAAAGKRIHSLSKIQNVTFFSCMSTLTVVLALDADFILIWSSGYSIRRLAASFIISLLLIAGLVLSALSTSSFKRFRFLTNNWTTCILLIGLPWTARELLIKGSAVDKAIASVLFFIITVCIAFVVQKILDSRHSGNSSLFIPAFSKHYTVFIISLSLITLGMSFFFKQSPYMHNLNLGTSSLTDNRPNIILIVMDAVRADHLTQYGYERETTPNIGNLAKEATLYTRSFSSEASDLSTTASIFTGMYASAHGAHYSKNAPNAKPLSDKFITLAEVLSEKGYITMGVVSDFVYLSRNFHMDQGFQYFDSRMPAHFFRKTQPFYIRNLMRHFLALIFSTHDYHVLYRRAEEINSAVFNLLDRVKGVKKPFFLFINYMDAHRPNIPPPPFDTLYPGKSEAVETDQNNLMSREIMRSERNITAEERNHLISQYDGGINYIDFHIGELIARLKEQGLYENTLIIITSDHGEAFGERNLMEHGVSVYQDQIYIPLIIKYPNDNDERVINDLVSSVDIMPTILDVTGFEISKGIQGVSLLKLGTVKTRSVISESFSDYGLLDLHVRPPRVERAIFSGPYKFISSTAGKKELYDLSRDPSEKENLYRPDDTVSGELELRLSQWLHSVAGQSSSSGKADEASLAGFARSIK
jgi:arylsulfatase A-like enzyme